MTKELKYLVVKRDLKFAGLKQKEKVLLYQKFGVILKKPKGVYKEQASSRDKITKKRKSKNKDIYNCLIDYCKKTDKKDRQFVFHGVYILLSIKEYYMLCSLFLLGDIDEQDFNTIDFRPKRCKVQNKKAKRNIEKSLCDLKISIREKIKEKCKTESTYFNANIKKEFDENFFKESFKNLAYIDKSLSFKVVKTLYKESTCSSL